MSTIFISHSSQDNEISQEMGRRLAEQNHPSVFLDLDPEKGIVAGRSWERTLYRKLRACRAVIALCTDNYLRSQWCFAEIALARMEGKHIFALQADPLSADAKMPSILTEKQFIDLRRDPEEAYQRLWRGLDELDVLGVANEWDPKKPPYLGLSAYREEHAPVFFGRDDEIRAGVELLDRGAPGLIMVLGASGSGKSSMVRAGIVPRLRRDADRWLIVGPFRPRRDPFAELAEAFAQAYQRYAPDEARSGETRERLRALRALGTNAGSGSEASAESAGGDGAASRLLEADARLPLLLKQLEELRRSPPQAGGSPLLDFLDWSLDDLRRICGEEPEAQPIAKRREAADTDTSTLVEIADHLRRASGHQDARVLLVIDQFEELLGHDDAWDDANRFLAHVRNACETERTPVMALGTMRSDFLGVFQRNRALLGIDFESLSVGPMHVDGMRRVIEEPARLGAVELEQGLADRLLADTETPDALPLLSFTMSVLWRDYRENGRLEVSEYEGLGGLHGAIAREADAVLASARRQGHEDDVRKAFLQMARLTEDGTYARKPVSWDREEIREVQPILEEFEKRRLLVTRMEKGEERTVEVAHEALFRSWAPLKTWLDDHRAVLMLQAQIRRDAQAWEEDDRATDRLWHGGRLQQAEELMRKGELGGTDAGNPEARFVLAGVRRRRQRRWTVAGTIVAIFVALASVAAWALIAERDATARQLLFESQLEFGVDNDRALLLAVEGARIRPWNEFDALLRKGLAERGQVLQVLEGHTDRVPWAAWHPNERRVVSVSEDGTARVWDMANGEPLPAATRQPFVTEAHRHSLAHVAWSRAGGRFVTSGSGRYDASVEGGVDRTQEVWNAVTGELAARLVGHEWKVWHADWSADDRRIATACADGVLRVWDSTSGDLLASFGDPAERKETRAIVAWHPTDDTRLLTTAGADGMARVWEMGSERPIATLKGHQAAVTHAAWNRDGTLIATSSDDRTARVWDATGGPALVELTGHTDGVNHVAWSPDGQSVVTAGKDHTARVWEVESGRQRFALVGHALDVIAAAWNDDGTRIVTISDDHTARLWDAVKGLKRAVLVGHSGPVLHAAWSPDSRYVMTASSDSTVRVWDPEATGPMPVLEGHTAPVVQAAWSPDDTRIVTASDDGTARVWDAETGKELARFTDHAAEVRFATWHPEGTRVISAGKDNKARAWDAKTGAEIRPFERHTAEVKQVAWSPDRRRIVTVGGDNTAHVWEAETAAYLLALDHEDAKDHPMTHAAWSGDAEHIVTTHWSFEGQARIWDARHGAMLFSLEGHKGGVWNAAWSPDSRRIVTAGNDNAARVWNAETGEPLMSLPHESGVRHATWNSLGTRIATVCEDKVGRVWDPESDEPLAELEGHGAEVRHAAWSPDDAWIATASQDGTARVWDPVTGKEVARLLGHEKPVRYVAWDASGRRVLTASDDGTVRVHHMLMEDLLSAAYRRAARDMTDADLER